MSGPISEDGLEQTVEAIEHLEPVASPLLPTRLNPSFPPEEEVQSPRVCSRGAKGSSMVVIEVIIALFISQ